MLGYLTIQSSFSHVVVAQEENEEEEEEEKWIATAYLRPERIYLACVCVCVCFFFSFLSLSFSFFLFVDMLKGFLGRVNSAR